MPRSSLSLLLLLTLALGMFATVQAIPTFCWRDSYGRGVGQIPTQCGNRDRILLLCYNKCPSGYTRSGFDCHQNCINNGQWRDDGLFCRRIEYGRGVGYPWKFGDPVSDSKQFARCNADNPVLGCEKWGLVVYPKCRSGYSPFGCCICRPGVPNCLSLGFNSGLDLSCAKKIIIGVPYTSGCGVGWQKNSGLCYPLCRSGYLGVGPVCWSKAPAGWVLCGMGAAKDKLTCAAQTGSQIFSVGVLVLNIATLGAGSATETAAQASTGLVAKIKEIINQLKILYNTVDQKIKPFKEDLIRISKIAGKAATVASVVATLTTTDIGKMSQAQLIKTAAQIASLFDPTGIASVVAAYSNPLCSKI